MKRTFTVEQVDGVFRLAVHGRRFNVACTLPNNDFGTAAANALCEAMPFLAVLAVRGPLIYLAHVDDKGTPA